MINDELIMKLIDEARKSCEKNFCCKHTKFSVGTALLTKSGKVYTAFNVENHGILSICGERSVFVKALTEGNTEFVAIAVIGKDMDTQNLKRVTPCGYCRQFMSEYATGDLMIFSYDYDEQKIYRYKLSDLLPESYDF